MVIDCVDAATAAALNIFDWIVVGGVPSMSSFFWLCCGDADILFEQQKLPFVIVVDSFELLFRDEFDWVVALLRFGSRSKLKLKRPVN